MKLLKLFYRNIKYYTIGIPAWSLHELMHYIAIGLIIITYPIHLEKIMNIKVDKFIFNHKQCHLSVKYDTYNTGWWIGIIISIAPRLLYIILPIVAVIINNEYISLYLLLLMTRRSLDLSYTDKRNIVHNLQLRKKLIYKT